ncbi:MAG: iron-sulfur cluster assembly scaffold protein [Candidatus Puniceispirillum sp.]|nr:iron-sulfur cluster assembly scaffold protein [Candidatus Puniceispirillum sp.]MBT6566878.1 iron-sulfur cluster assembly scaffold protein [Candidatus Puniceispirillum sp.]
MDALYQKQILSLAHRARASTLDFTPSQSATCNNPVCGDKVSVSIAVKADHIANISVHVKGCALCEAGAGLLLECAQNGDIAETTTLGAQLNAFLTSGANDQSETDDDHVNRFAAFAPVKDISNRHKCVLLAFDAFNEAINLFRADGDLVKSP